MKTKKLTKKEINEFIDIIKFTMNDISIKDEKSMNDFSALSVTLLKACRSEVTYDDLVCVEEIIKKNLKQHVTT